MILSFIKGVLSNLAAPIAAIFLLKENTNLKRDVEDAEARAADYKEQAEGWSNISHGNHTVVRLLDAARNKRKNRSKP